MSTHTVTPSLAVEQKSATAVSAVSGGTLVAEDDLTFQIISSVTGLVDQDNDITVPGCYERTLRERTPKIIKDHEWANRLGVVTASVEMMPGDPRLPDKLPNGDPWPREAGALIHTVKLFNSEAGREAADRWRTDPDQQFSIGYITRKSVQRKDGVRLLTDVDLLEVSDVLWGANTWAGMLPGSLSGKMLRGIAGDSAEPDLEVLEGYEAALFAMASKEIDWVHVRLAAKVVDAKAARQKVSTAKIAAQPSKYAPEVKRAVTHAERKAAAVKGDALSDGTWVIETEDDLHAAIDTADEDSAPTEVLQHIATRATALDRYDLIPEAWKDRLAESLGEEPAPVEDEEPAEGDDTEIDPSDPSYYEPAEGEDDGPVDGESVDDTDDIPAEFDNEGEGLYVDENEPDDEDPMAGLPSVDDLVVADAPAGTAPVAPPTAGDVPVAEAKAGIPGTADTPGEIRGAEALRRYWTSGPGGAKIVWNTDGDFTRCSVLLREHMSPERAKGYCANLHKRATGMWPGDKRNKDIGEALMAKGAVTLDPATVKAADPVLTVTSTYRSPALRLADAPTGLLVDAPTITVHGDVTDTLTDPSNPPAPLAEWDPTAEVGKSASHLSPETKMWPNMPGSLDERLSAVREAIEKTCRPASENVEASEGEMAPVADSGDGGWYPHVLGVFDDHALYESRGATYQVGYSWWDGTVTLDEPEKVRIESSVVPETAAVHTATDLMETVSSALAMMPGYKHSAVGRQGAEEKAGRVLSGSNAQRLQHAAEHLVAVLTAAGVTVLGSEDQRADHGMATDLYADPMVDDTSTRDTTMDEAAEKDPALVYPSHEIDESTTAPSAQADADGKKPLAEAETADEVADEDLVELDAAEIDAMVAMVDGLDLDDADEDTTEGLEPQTPGWQGSDGDFVGLDDPKPGEEDESDNDGDAPVEDETEESVPPVPQVDGVEDVAPGPVEGEIDEDEVDEEAPSSEAGPENDDAPTRDAAAVTGNSDTEPETPDGEVDDEGTEDDEDDEEELDEFGNPIKKRKPWDKDGAKDLVSPAAMLMTWSALNAELDAALDDDDV